MLARLVSLGASLAALIVFGTTASTAAFKDSGRIAFATNRAQDLQRSAIYSIRPDGRGQRLVALPSPPVSSFVRSSDGKRILFSHRVDSGYALFIAGRWGESPTRITPPDMSYVSEETFSPDGRKVAFEGWVDCTTPCSHQGVYIVNVDGTGLTEVVENALQPSWAPDSRRLAYTSAGRIFIGGLAGEPSRRLGTGYHPVWAPRGERIAYLVDKGSYGVACVVSSNGSGRRCILGRSAIGVVWSSDGKRLAFHQASCDCVAIVGADGRGLRVFEGPPPQYAYPVAWSPDDRRIAYIAGEIHEQIIFRSVSGRSVPRSVTREPRYTSFSDVRWRGGRISYVAYRSYNDYEIAVMNADGTRLRTLTHNDLSDRQPTWSPDGRTIAFARLDGESSGLRLIGADGSRDRALTTNGAWRDMNPAWSPDGLRVAFVRTPHNSYGGDLMLVNRDGRNLHTVSIGTAVASQISWSPDGRYIAFSALTGFYSSDLYVIGADGSDGRRLVTGRYSAAGPSWSPDGSRILFAGTAGPPRENETDLFTIRPDGTGATRVATNISSWSPAGAWSPDGSRIVYARGSASIVTSNPDGSGEIQLTRNPSSNVEPAWSR